MRKNAFLFALLSFFSAFSLHAEWVLLGRQQATTTSSITITNLMTSTYEDYMFVVDMMEPLGGFADVVMQFSSDNGSTWIASYNGGISSFQSGDTALKSNEIPNKGIAVTDIAHAGYYFVGTVRVSNANSANNYGLLSVNGQGTMGPIPAYGCVYGTIGADTVNAVRFVSSNPTYPTINRASVTIYGLTEF